MDAGTFINGLLSRGYEIFTLDKNGEMFIPSLCVILGGCFSLVVRFIDSQKKKWLFQRRKNNKLRRQFAFALKYILSFLPFFSVYVMMPVVSLLKSIREWVESTSVLSCSLSFAFLSYILSLILIICLNYEREKDSLVRKFVITFVMCCIVLSVLFIVWAFEISVLVLVLSYSVAAISLWLIICCIYLAVCGYTENIHTNKLTAIFFIFEVVCWIAIPIILFLFDASTKTTLTIVTFAIPIIGVALVVLDKYVVDLNKDVYELATVKFKEHFDMQQLDKVESVELVNEDTVRIESTDEERIVMAEDIDIITYQFTQNIFGKAFRKIGHKIWPLGKWEYHRRQDDNMSPRMKYERIKFLKYGWRRYEPSESGGECLVQKTSGGIHFYRNVSNNGLQKVLLEKLLNEQQEDNC